MVPSAPSAPTRVLCGTFDLPETTSILATLGTTTILDTGRRGNRVCLCRIVQPCACSFSQYVRARSAHGGSSVPWKFPLLHRTPTTQQSHQRTQCTDWARSLPRIVSPSRSPRQLQHLWLYRGTQFPLGLASPLSAMSQSRQRWRVAPQQMLYVRLPQRGSSQPAGPRHLEGQYSHLSLGVGHIPGEVRSSKSWEKYSSSTTDCSRNGDSSISTRRSNRRVGPRARDVEATSTAHADSFHDATTVVGY